MTMIFPGAGPVPFDDWDEAVAVAAANMTVFVQGVTGRGGRLSGDVIRDAAADREGRFGFLLPGTAGGQVRVLMPGAGLDRLRDVRSASAPCIYVNGTPWYWNDAVGQAGHAAEAVVERGTDTPREQR